MKSFKVSYKEWYLFFVLAFIILGITFALRFINLTNLPVFVDEAIYIRWAQIMRAEPTLRFIPLSDGKQPLFMWVVIPFLKVFEDPLLAGRLVSTLTGLGSLVGISVFAYLLFNSKRIALVAATFYAISPYTVFFDRMALVDSMLSFFGIWFLVFSYLSIKHLRLDMAMLAGFALGGALLTKSPSLFFVILLPSTLLLVPWKQTKGIFTKIGKTISLWGVTIIIGYAIQSILRLGPGFANLGSRNLDYVHPYTHILQSPFDPLLPHLDRAIEWLIALGPFILLVLIIIALLSNARSIPVKMLFLLLWAFLPVVVQSAYAKVFTARYIYFTIPYMLILAASAFYFYENEAKLKVIERYTKLGKKVLPLLFVMYIVHALFVSTQLVLSPESAPLPRSERSGYLEDWTSGGGIREAAKYILEVHESDPQKPILVGTEGYFGTLPDGLQIYLQGVPNVNVIGIGIDIHQVPQSLIDSHKAGNKTYLLANSSRLKLRDSIEDHNLKLVFEFKKPLRPNEAVKYHEDGPYETLYLFELQ